MRPGPRDPDATQPMPFAPRTSARAAGGTIFGSPIPEPSRGIVTSVIAFGAATLLLAFALSADGTRGVRDRPIQTAPPAVAGTPPPASPQRASTPSVIGKNTYEAGRVLIAAGFASPVRWFVEPGAKGAPCTVVRQEPTPGAAHERGARAVLYVTQGC